MSSPTDGLLLQGGARSEQENEQLMIANIASSHVRGRCGMTEKLAYTKNCLLPCTGERVATEPASAHGPPLLTRRRQEHVDPATTSQDWTFR